MPGGGIIIDTIGKSASKIIPAIERSGIKGKVATVFSHDAADQAARAGGRHAAENMTRSSLNNGRAYTGAEKMGQLAGRAGKTTAKGAGKAYLAVGKAHPVATGLGTVAGGYAGYHYVKGKLVDSKGQPVNNPGQVPQANGDSGNPLTNALVKGATSPLGLGALGLGGMMLMGKGGMLGSALKMAALVMIVGELAKHGNEIMSALSNTVGKSAGKVGPDAPGGMVSNPTTNVAAKQGPEHTGDTDSQRDFEHNFASQNEMSAGRQHYVAATRDNVNQMVNDNQPQKSKSLNYNGPVAEA